jgi:hypothetical protein
VEPTLTTTVRIAHAGPRPGDLGNGVFITHGYLVVLADDPRHRALPVWFRGHPGGGSLSRLHERAGALAAGAPEELTARLLGAAGASVTGVDIDLAATEGTPAQAGELDPDAWTARIELGGPAGPRHVSTPFGLGLAVAAATDAPVRVPVAVLDRLAVPVPGDDLVGPFLDRLPPAARAQSGRVGGWPARLPSRRARYEPRNLTFADGLDWWDLDGHGAADYAATAEDGTAILSATTERPAGPVILVQTLHAEDYRGVSVTFSGEIRTAPLTYEAGLRVEILRDRLRVRDDRGVTIAGRSAWARHEVTVAVPGDAEILRFGVVLSGPGEIALRHPAFSTGVLSAGPRAADS